MVPAPRAARRSRKVAGPVRAFTVEEARAVLAVLGAFPGTTVVETVPGFRDWCVEVARRP